ncbi:glycolate oxidase FAD binding subunit [Kushneria sinocarnis]|uniref:Glycolate oxidase FAD binding subunit n=1 Tax=Kushneria sinocarnis TaxID=595502 RepID=A0A420X0K1_9GAMM|nr:glycolate oxidase subunit GlcE [Kushneria sinocarnis]RKR07280.1 glycolate oxidase FAD binding subunit [Kushneria sinocarnis]
MSELSSRRRDSADGVLADDSAALCEQVGEASAKGTPLAIVGGNSKAFYGRPVTGEALDVRGHRGIVHYDPVELIVTVRCGTPLSELEATLAQNGQQLAFEPPRFAPGATVGGMVACGLSGPRRPWAGAVRDHVLGTRLITGEGRQLRLGGEVMKNVAGYDVSRLVTGALGSLGVITEVSLKVLPQPPQGMTLRLELDAERAARNLAEWGRQPLPLSGACHDGEALHVRLEGGEGSIRRAREQLGGEQVSAAFWEALREQQLPFFNDPRPLWRCSLPATAPGLALAGDWLIDWAGAQRWLKSDAEPAHIRATVSEAGGHATCFTPNAASPFTPLPRALLHYHRRLKAELDPAGIFNPGRWYAEL